MRGATTNSIRAYFDIEISTHTPRAGRDFKAKKYGQGKYNISTHTPLAGRDLLMLFCGCRPSISTHTPLAGRDILRKKFAIILCNFYSHAPCGARRVTPWVTLSILLFLLTRPLRGATSANGRCEQLNGISTHTPLAGRDRQFRNDVRSLDNFYSHAPCGARP